MIEELPTCTEGVMHTWGNWYSKPFDNENTLYRECGACGVIQKKEATLADLYVIGRATNRLLRELLDEIKTLEKEKPL